jgi:hypothetical protein
MEAILWLSGGGAVLMFALFALLIMAKKDDARLKDEPKRRKGKDHV